MHVLWKVWEWAFDAGVRPLRRLYHLRKLRMVIGRNYRSPRDSAEHFARGRREWEEADEASVNGALALMPVIMPKHHKECKLGHRMFGRTVPLPGYEMIRVLGCDGNGCRNSVRDRIEDFAVAYGIDVDRDPNRFTD